MAISARRPGLRFVRRDLAVLAALFLLLTMLQAVVLASPVQAAVGFGKGTLQGANPKDRSTTVQFGPDGRLYVPCPDRRRRPRRPGSARAGRPSGR